MAAAYRVNGGSAKYVGSKQHMSKAFCDFNRGHLDFTRGRSKPMNPSPGYDQGWNAAEREKLLFDQAIQLEKIRKELGVDRYTFNEMRDCMN